MDKQAKPDNTKEHIYTRHIILIPVILVFIFVAVMVVNTSRLTYNVAVLNSGSVIEDRIKNVSSLVENHLNTAENVLQITADSVQHMLISGSTPARIHEFLVEESNNVSEQFGENYFGIYGYVMSKYMDGLNWEPPADYDPKTRDWYIVAKESNGEVAIVPPYYDAQTGSMIISVCRMLSDRQNILSMDVHLDGIQEMAKELTINGKGYGFIMDETGLVIAHTDPENNGKYIDVTTEGTELLEGIKKTGSGTFVTTYENDKSTVYVNGIMNGWYVVMVVSNSELYREVTRQLLFNAFICFMVFIMIASLYYVAHRNERAYTRQMEEMKLEEQKAAYERKVLELEKDAADASNKAKSDFLANMSHEIRTPMNAIIGMDEMILRESGDPKIIKYANNIQSAGKTLLSIVNDILDLSKIESGKMELIPSEYDFASVLNDIVNMTKNKANEKGLRYELNASQDIPSVMYGDEIRIRQIILNVVNNAIKYTAAGKVAIDISFDPEKNELKIVVSDTGFGIKQEDLEKLFDSFQRLDETKNRNIEGTGLGLNITKRLAEMMGGSISVESEYGKGSVFSVTVIQKVVDAAPIGNYTERLEKADEKKEDYKPMLVAPNAKVLIVDDNEMNLEVISELMSDTKIRIKTALSGRECLDMVRRERFDIVFLDQMMPGLSGIQTLLTIRRENLCGDTPIIVLTADAIVGAKDAYIREGFADYLSKPVIYSDLEALLVKYLDDSLILSRDQIEAEERKAAEKAAVSGSDAEDKPVVLVINKSPEKLKELKEVLSARYKGVFVKDEAAAEKYLSKHEVEFIIRDGKDA